MSAPREGGSNAEARRSAYSSKKHRATRYLTTQENNEVLADDEEMAPGLALPDRGPRWDPANEQWTRGVMAVFIMASVSLVIVMCGAALLSGKVAIQDLAVFLSVILTPVSGVVGYYYGRRSASRR
jgi:hypothetical protein